MSSKSDIRIREEVDRLGRPNVEMLDTEILRQERKESYSRLTRGVITGLIAAVAVILVVTNLWLAVLQVDGSSMNPLLRMNDIVLTVRTSSPAPSDVAAFYHNNKIYIKRVIAIGGDIVDITRDGRVSVNGTNLNEPYVARKSIGDCDIEFPYQVPSGTFFVLGDNRPTALDSRNSEFGTISRDQIIGKVIFRLWPLTRIKGIS
ncbi:MAG: signal peptidase I [Coriobacteriia bacterium]|nr:signal peptidase I [Coriobacteriia bacterium]